MLNNRYRVEIQKLDLLISNWAFLAESETRYFKLGSIDLDLEMGLCHNAGLYNVPSSVLHESFASWSGFSGSLGYPVEGKKAFYEHTNKFTVERLRLAKHLRTDLFIKGSPKPTFSEKVDKILDNKFISVPLAFTMFFVMAYYMAKLI